MRRQGERPELIRWRLCGTSKTWSFVPQRRMKMFQARVPGIAIQSSYVLPKLLTDAEG